LCRRSTPSGAEPPPSIEPLICPHCQGRLIYIRTLSPRQAMGRDHHIHVRGQLVVSLSRECPRHKDLLPTMQFDTRILTK